MKNTKKGSAEQSEMGLTLEGLIRRGARELIQKALEVEVQEPLARHRSATSRLGCRRCGTARALV